MSARRVIAAKVKSYERRDLARALYMLDKLQFVVRQSFYDR